MAWMITRFRRKTSLPPAGWLRSWLSGRGGCSPPKAGPGFPGPWAWSILDRHWRPAAGIAEQHDSGCDWPASRAMRETRISTMAIAAPDRLSIMGRSSSRRCSQVWSRPWGDCGASQRRAGGGGWAYLRHALGPTGVRFVDGVLPEPLLNCTADMACPARCQRRPSTQHPGHQGGCGRAGDLEPALRLADRLGGTPGQRPCSTGSPMWSPSASQPAS